jgi:hypothetical protein
MCLCLSSLSSLFFSHLKCVFLLSEHEEKDGRAGFGREHIQATAQQRRSQISFWVNVGEAIIL